MFGLAEHHAHLATSTLWLSAAVSCLAAGAPSSAYGSGSGKKGNNDDNR